MTASETRRQALEFSVRVAEAAERGGNGPVDEDVVSLAIRFEDFLNGQHKRAAAEAPVDL